MCTVDKYNLILHIWPRLKMKSTCTSKHGHNIPSVPSSPFFFFRRADFFFFFCGELSSWDSWLSDNTPFSGDVASGDDLAESGDMELKDSSPPGSPSCDKSWNI